MHFLIRPHLVHSMVAITQDTQKKFFRCVVNILAKIFLDANLCENRIKKIAPSLEIRKVTRLWLGLVYTCKRENFEFGDAL